MHQVGGLHNQSLHTVGNRTVQSLFHVIDLLAVTGLDVVDDDLGGEGAADGPVGESLGQSILNALDVFHTAVVEGSTEGDDQQFLLADLVLVPGIVQRRVAGIQAEVLGTCLFALDQLLLSIGQGVPGSLGGLALGVGLVVAGLDIDGVDQSSNLIGSSLVNFLLRLGSLSGSLGGSLGSGLRGGSRSGSSGAVAAAGSHGQNHANAQQQSNQFFHGGLPSFSKFPLNKI